jgi:cyclic-di-GMP-binding protein
MAAQHSFDIVSKIDMQEVTNAMNQAMKEIQTRYDFRGSKSNIELNQKDKLATMIADDDYKMRALVEIFQGKLVKRKVPLKAVEFGEVEEASAGMMRRKVSFQSGIDKENARLIVKLIKEMKLKVQAAIQDDQVRVTGPKIDVLQSIMEMLKEKNLPFDMQFVNYR